MERGSGGGGWGSRRVLAAPCLTRGDLHGQRAWRARRAGHMKKVTRQGSSRATEGREHSVDCEEGKQCACRKATD